MTPNSQVLIRQLSVPHHGAHVVLFCGGRDCTDDSHGEIISADVRSLGVGSVVLHGGQGCDTARRVPKGADALADYYGRQHAYERELHVARVDALWHAFGKRGGPLRNNVMARMLRPAFAYCYPTGGPGTAGMIEILKREGIPYVVREVANV